MKLLYGYVLFGIIVAIVAGLIIFFTNGTGGVSGTILTYNGMAKSFELTGYEVVALSLAGHVMEKTFSDVRGHYSFQLPVGDYIICTKGKTNNPVRVSAGQNITLNLLIGKDKESCP